jgi:hypothetical protein
MIRMNNSKTVLNIDVYLILGLFLIAALGYFCLVANYILFFQETQALFIFSGEYLHQYLLKPGGLLEYAARFLIQFYAGKFPGAIILSVILTLPGIILYIINKRLIPGISFSLLFLLIPSCLMLLMQANYYHMMEYNLGFVLILFYYLFSISSGKKYHRILVLMLFPLFYYLAGAYVIIFAGMYIIHNLSLEKGKQKYIYTALLLSVAVVTFLIFWKIIFLQPVEHIILFPLPLLENAAYKATFFILTGYIVFYPLICRVAILLKNSWLNKRFYSFMSIIIVFAIAIFLLFKIYNPQTARVVELERLIFGEKWDEAIRFQEKKPSRNLIGQYFYNIALSETDQLCDRLFFGSQDFGAGSLVLPWGDEHLNRGAYFYYSIGLINEAHRWAYEEMVVYGYRPQNIKLLAKTSLINGDYRMARKYINILKRTIYYRDWAKKFEAMADNPDLIRSHPELGAKLKILPKNNFFIKFNEPQNNLPLLLEAQPDNRKAFEYYLAGLLLTKNVEIIMNNISKMKGMGYTRIPRHIEEAVLIYYNSTKEFPDLGGLKISAEIQARFDQYFAAYIEARRNPSTMKEKMQQEFVNTFWFYFHFK